MPRLSLDGSGLVKGLGGGGRIIHDLVRQGLEIAEYANQIKKYATMATAHLSEIVWTHCSFELFQLVEHMDNQNNPLLYKMERLLAQLPKDVNTKRHV